VKIDICAPFWSQTADKTRQERQEKRLKVMEGSQVSQKQLQIWVDSLWLFLRFPRFSGDGGRQESSSQNYEASKEESSSETSPRTPQKQSKNILFRHRSKTNLIETKFSIAESFAGGPSEIESQSTLSLMILS
jgi:hypothetical protein